MTPTHTHTADDAAATSPTRWRASDADRMAVAEVLQDAVGRGLLTPAEGSERTATALSAMYRDELTPLTADLPPTPRATKRRRPDRDTGEGRRGGARRGRARTWWWRIQALTVQVWSVVVGVVSSWSPKRRVVVGVVVAVLLVLLVGFGIFDFGGGRDGHGTAADAAGRLRG